MKILVMLPWEYVMHDNHRLMPIRMGKGARLITAPKYRDAKEAAVVDFRRQWVGSPMLAGRISLTGVVFMPDRRKRDAGNYRKLITDALTGIAYADDSELVQETWILGGVVGKEKARVEIAVEGTPTERIVQSAFAL